MPDRAAIVTGAAALSQSLQQELHDAGVRATTLAPAFVATPMTEALTRLDQAELIRPQDVAEAVRFLTRLSPNCAIPEIRMLRPAERLLAASGGHETVAPVTLDRGSNPLRSEVLAAVMSTSSAGRARSSVAPSDGPQATRGIPVRASAVRAPAHTSQRHG